MNPAAGSTVQRQSTTLIAALKTRVADQSSDACQYFRIIAEGCLLVSFPLLLPFSLLPFIPSISFLLLHSAASFFLYVVAPSTSSLHAKPNECRRESQTMRRGSVFFNATRRRFNAAGIMRLDRLWILLEIVADKGRVNRILRTPLGTSRRSLVSCRALPGFLIKSADGVYR